MGATFVSFSSLFAASDTLKHLMETDYQLIKTKLRRVFFAYYYQKDCM